nr:hypothetical protein CFP56_22186 [Quercus suber]
MLDARHQPRFGSEFFVLDLSSLHADLVRDEFADGETDTKAFKTHYLEFAKAKVLFTRSGTLRLSNVTMST